MRAIPPALERAIKEEMERRGLSAGTRQDWMKWLRYFLDFCGKYQHPPREEKSLQPFLQKLASKGQSGSSQARAVESIRLFLEVVKRFPPPEEQGGGREGSFGGLERMFKTPDGRDEGPALLPEDLEIVHGLDPRLSAIS